MYEDEIAVFAQGSLIGFLELQRDLQSWKICALNSQERQSYAHFRKFREIWKSTIFD